MWTNLDGGADRVVRLIGAAVLGVGMLLGCSVDPQRVGGVRLGNGSDGDAPGLEFRKATAVGDAALGEYSIKLRPEVLGQAKAGDVITLEMPDKSTARFTVARVGEVMAGTTSIYARGADQSNDQLHLSFAGNAVQGEIQAGKGDWLIETRGDQIQLIDMVAKQWTRLPPHRHDMKNAPDLPTLPAGQGEQLQAQGDAMREAAMAELAQKAAAATSASPVTLDLLVVADQGLYNAYGSTNAMNAAIASMISVSNQAYTDSGVYAQIRVVGTYLLPTTLTASKETMLDQVNQGVAPFTDVWRQRVQVGADMVLLYMPFRDIDVTTGSCGLAYIGTFNSTSGTFRANRNPVATASGIKTNTSSYTCSTYTPVHELGHMLGSAHDRDNSSGASPAYTYSYGYGVTGVFGDIMSYLQPRIGQFSNPNRTYNGYAMGVPEGASNSADATKTFNNTLPLAAQFLDAQSRYSGWYWNAAEGGTGWAVDVRNGRSFVAYFHYDAAGMPTWLAGTGSDCSSGGTVQQCVNLQKYSGGQTAAGAFKAIGPGVDTASLVLSFSNTFPPTATAQITSSGASRSVNLQRFIFNSAKAIGDQPTAPLDPLPQWRWDAAAPGTGVFVEYQGDQVFAAYFNYDSAGNPIWQVSQGQPYYTSNGSLYFNQLNLAEYRNGQTLMGAYKTPYVNNSAFAKMYVSSVSDFLQVNVGSQTRTTYKFVRYDF